MIQADAYKTIRQRLGGRESETTLDAWIVDELANAIEDLERSFDAEYAWWLEGTESVAFTVGDNVTALSSNFLFEIERSVHLITTDKFLYKKDYDELQIKYGSTVAQGQPKYYTIVGTDLYVYPIPDKSYTVSMRAYKSTSEAIWLIHAGALLVAQVAEIINNMYIGDDTLAQRLAAKAQEQLIKYRSTGINKKNVNRHRGYSKRLNS